MHRFRRKSETKRSAAVPGAPVPASPQARAPPPTLPPASDFRTSLILPSLSRRFTILRNSSGEPLSPAQVRSRLAEQRLRGLANHITEEEEDMMIEALEHMRSSTSNASTDASLSASQSSTTNPDGSSSYFADSDGPRSPSLYPQSSFSSSQLGGRKLSDNNLFASTNRLREEEYLRTVVRSNRNARAGAASGPVTPPRVRNIQERTSESPQDSNKHSMALVLPTPNVSPRAVTDPADPFIVGNSRLKPERPVTPGLVRRASLALAQALRDLEREMGALQEGKESPEIPEFDDDDTVLAPFQSTASAVKSGSENVATAIDASPNYVADGTRSSAVSPIANSPRHQRMNSASPVPNTEARVPGYIPGMHRPITPIRDRDSDVEEFPTFSNTTTPRASSPISPLRTSKGGVNSPSRSYTYPRQRSNTGSSQNISSTVTSETVTPTTPYFGSRDRNPHTSVSAIPHNLPSVRSGNHSLSSFPSSSPRINGSMNDLRSSPRTAAQGTAPSAMFDMSSQHRGAGDASPNGFSNERGKSLDPTQSLSSPALPGSGWNGFPTQRDVDTSRGAGMNATAAVLASLREHNVTPVSLCSPTRSPAGDKVIVSTSRPVSPAMKGTGTGGHYSHTPSSSASSAFFQGDKFRRPSENEDTRSLSPSGLPFQRNLVLSPLLNSSHSSLISAGSSFHSGEGNDPVNFKKLYELDTLAKDDLEDSDPTLVNSDDSEEVLEKLAGLRAADITAIHQRLVEAGLGSRTDSSRSSSVKQTTPPLVSTPALTPFSGRTLTLAPDPAVPASAHPPVSPTILQEDPTKDIITYRPPSRTTPSPAPPSMKSRTPDLFKSTERSPTPASDHASKQNALLRSVMDRIGGSPSSTPPPASQEPVSRIPLSPDFSPASVSTTDTGFQKQRELTDALFGDAARRAATAETLDKVDDDTVLLQDVRPKNKASENFSSPSLSPSPSPPENQMSVAVEKPQTQLIIDVERRAAAATAALKSPSALNVAEDYNLARRRPTKRINTSKISNPLLVSSTTSVDAVPIMSPSMVSLTNGSPSSSLSKFSFKRLRGSLRSKAPNGDEVTPWTDASGSLPAHKFSSSISHVNQLLKTPQSLSVTASLAQVQTLPPVSASPRSGLKGFMSRIMKGRKDVGLATGRELVKTSESMSPSEPSLQDSSLERIMPSRIVPDSISNRPNPMASARTNEVSAAIPVQQHPTIVDDPRPTSPPQDEAALHHFMQAGAILGLSQDVLNDFLSRSGSIATQRSMRKATPPPDPGDPVSAASPNDSTLASRKMPDSQSSTTKSTTAGANIGPHNSAQDATPVVVRRTIYIPQESKPALSPDLQNVVARKSSLKQNRHNRSASSTSTQSGRSISDRAPTPPPSRSVRHRSVEVSPPVPSLPSSLPRDSQVTASRRVSNQSATHDARNSNGNPTSSFSFSSLAPTSTNPSLSHQLKPKMDPLEPAAGPGQALQLVEYSNGQVVWSVVDGLRAGADDDWDLEDTFDDTQSFTERDPRHRSQISSVRSGDFNDPVQLFFKEHKRMPSKESNSSYISRRRVLPPSRTADPRPETKVFFSSAAEIEKLIESMSRGIDAGSFNVVPHSPTPQSSPGFPLQLSRHPGPDNSGSPPSSHQI
ncbi:uncharacterized protein EI90DRAFT_3121608 [Cantharellus anzutake]|uniref:uncharacterized protein n=1 Tax=Cantharellus anzutake TaxID=1750568 RepID=UPI001904A39F|nr:uncharacterized protein EI90DRAFT_3121608 [Cantharellus anzutake]KAF8334281.1 hypothetical protein EI90DRAFT_3121608 [Cantharellus anzutake]